ncbi:MAG TPA: hypothetical protein PKD84_04625 [Propionicimonas sp.]|jgi:hypothetical protein|nr:hypothetical protein [Propionicimonas sp.]
MPTVDADVSRWIVASHDTEVMVMDSVASHVLTDAESAEDSAFNQSLEWTLRRFQDRFASSWVTGRVTLTSEALQFYPRETTEEVTSPTPIALRLNEVIDISTESRLFHKAVRVMLASGQTLTFRCRAPEVFAEQIRTVAGAVRAMSA